MEEIVPDPQHLLIRKNAATSFFRNEMPEHGLSACAGADKS
jgi:hypothetical protein